MKVLIFLGLVIFIYVLVADVSWQLPTIIKLPLLYVLSRCIYLRYSKCLLFTSYHVPHTCQVTSKMIANWLIFETGKSLKPNNPIDLNAGKHNQPPDMTRWMEEWLPALAHFTFQWNHNVLLSNWNSTWHTKCISIWLLQFFLNHSQCDFFFFLSSPKRA